MSDKYYERQGKRVIEHTIDRTTMIIPDGKLRGSLPWNILINGDRWDVIKTGVVKGRTYDKIENSITGERKTYERSVLLAFLKKNWRAWQKKMRKNLEDSVVKTDNSCTLAQNSSPARDQKTIHFPTLDF